MHDSLLSLYHRTLERHHTKGHSKFIFFNFNYWWFSEHNLFSGCYEIVFINSKTSFISFDLVLIPG